MRALLLIKKICFHVIRVCVRPYYGKGIWLISDRPWVAGDNGEAFFKYMSSKAERAIFVIKRNVPDYKRLQEYGEVIGWGTIKHKILLCTADVCLSSHNSFMKNHEETNQVFLQHGVRMNNYHSYTNEVQHNKFYLCVASETEMSRYNSSEYKISSSHIWLTGAPRYDFLASEPKNRIVLALTWRYYECGKSLEDFIATNYFKRFVEIITDDELNKKLKEYGYELCYMAHPMTRKYIEQMNFTGVKALSNYNIEVFKEGSLLISDYSSVVCDMAYLHKPVVFYQFDSEEFFDYKWVIPEFDYEHDSFGPVVKTFDQLKEVLLRYCENRCVMEKEYQNRIDKFIKYHDTNNCQRVYEKIHSIL